MDNTVGCSFPTQFHRRYESDDDPDMYYRVPSSARMMYRRDRMVPGRRKSNFTERNSSPRSIALEAQPDCRIGTLRTLILQVYIVVIYCAKLPMGCL